MFPIKFLRFAIIASSGIAFCERSDLRAEEFRDCPTCPVMVTIPVGTFVMGAPAEELKREKVGADYASWEQPQHRVTISRPIAAGKFEVTREQFAEFTAATGRQTDQGCHADFGSSRADFQLNERKSWRDPGFPQGDDHPVVCVSWNDAQAYAAWLSSTTGHAYRLPTEAEWEYFTRAGTATARYWGDDRDAICANANGTDSSAMKHFGWEDQERASPCADEFVYTAPVGIFSPNQFGLYDTLGNAWEWVEDCFVPNYGGAPTDGSARMDSSDCQQRVFRGGGWLNSPVGLRAAARGRRPVDGRFNVGVRVVRDLD